MEYLHHILLITLCLWVIWAETRASRNQRLAAHWQAKAQRTHKVLLVAAAAAGVGMIARIATKTKTPPCEQ